MKNRIIVVPNSEVTRKGKTYNVLKSQKDFYQNFELYDYQVTIAAIIRESEKEFFGWNIQEAEHINCLKQNVFSNYYSTFRKVIIYFITVFITFFTVLKNKKFYLFVPGNISTVYLIFLILFKKEYGLYVRGDFTRNREKKLYEWALSKAKFVITTGNYVTKLCRAFNSNVEPVVPMMNTSMEDLYLEKTISFSGKPKLLFVGRLSVEKGIEELLEAASILRNNEIGFSLDIVGGGEKEWFETAQKKLVEKDMETSVNILGPISDKNKLNQLFKTSDMLVFPSHHEGFPRVVYEAMTFGLPMILTDLRAYKDILEHKKDCTKVGVRDSKGLADSIKELIENENLRKSYSQSGLSMMASQYKEFEKNKDHTHQVVKQF